MGRPRGSRPHPFPAGQALADLILQIEQLSPRELSGVLAHELGRHLGGHMVLTIGDRLPLPVVLLALIRFCLQHGARAHPGCQDRRGSR